MNPRFLYPGTLSLYPQRFRAAPGLTQKDLTFVPELGGYYTDECSACGQTWPVSERSSSEYSADLVREFFVNDQQVKNPWGTLSYSSWRKFDPWVKFWYEDYTR